MRKILTLTLVLFFSISTTSIIAQTQSDYEPLQMLIKFDVGISQSDITEYMNEIEATEIWKTPITKTRLWELENFNGVQTYYNDSTIDDIIGTIIVQDGRDDIDEVGLNFRTKITDGVAGTGPGGGPGNPASDNAETLPSYAALCHKNIDKAGGSNANLRIAVLDTGNDSYFSGINPVFEYNYVFNTSNGLDFNGHGTTMFNLIGTTFEANSLLSVDDIEWDNRVTHDYQGFGDISNILLAMEEAAEAGADVINMSFSYLCTDSLVNLLFEESIDELESMNILINASAGNQENDNDGPQSLRAYPATYENYNIISVGAYNCFTNDISSFSNWGHNSVDILAPGNEIEGFSFTPSGVGGGTQSGSTPTNGNGCSQATAITSGLALALGTHQSSWDYVEVKCAILKGAEKKNLTKDILTSGLINGPNALYELDRGCYDIIDTPVSNSNTGRRSRNNERTFKSETIVKTYPNPVSETLNIDISEFNSIVDIKLIDGLGQLVRSIPNTSNSIIQLDVSELNQGIYMIKCESDKMIISKSVIIE